MPPAGLDLDPTTCSDYKRQQAALDADYFRAIDALGRQLASCKDDCENRQTETERKQCRDECLSAYNRAVAPIYARFRQQSDTLDKNARKNGALVRHLIITDSRHEKQAKDRRRGNFSDATIVPVGTPEAFIKELQKDRCAGMLMLVLGGDDTGKLEIDGKPVTLRGRAGLQLDVSDEILLEGGADAPIRPSESDALKSGLSASVIDNRDVLGPPLPPPPQVSVDVDPTDSRTHSAKSSLGSTGKTHFVTVKGDGRAILRATLVTNDTVENRKAISWEAGPGTAITVPPNDPLAVSLSRGTAKKAELRLKFKGAIIKELVVWVVWCDLTAHMPPRYSGKSPLDGETLGTVETRVDPPDPAYRVQGSIDWHFAVKPAAIISDSDRPALEHPDRVVPVPGSGVMPIPFFGWELATDTREKTSEVFGTTGRVVVTSRSEYSWPGGDVEGASLADVRANPYPVLGTALPIPDPSWPTRWDAPFPDSYGRNGLIAGFHKQARIFVRVQLGETWYRCSNKATYRLRASAKKSAGKWDPEPNTKPVLELNNTGW